MNPSSVHYHRLQFSRLIRPYSDPLPASLYAILRHFRPSPPPLHRSNHLIALRAPFSRLFSLYGLPVTPIPATQPHRKATFHRIIRHLYHKIESFSGYKISTSRIAFTSRVTSAKIACNLLFFCVRRADVYKAIFRLVRKHTVVAQQIYVILLMY